MFIKLHIINTQKENNNINKETQLKATAPIMNFEIREADSNSRDFINFLYSFITKNVMYPKDILNIDRKILRTNTIVFCVLIIL